MPVGVYEYEEIESGIYEGAFSEMKDTLHQHDWGDTVELKFLVKTSATEQKTVTQFARLDDWFAQQIWKMTGKLPTADVINDPMALFDFARHALETCAWKGHIQVKKGGLARGVCPPPEARYVCRYGGITSRDEDGLPGPILQESSFSDSKVPYVYFLLVLQEGEWAGFGTTLRVKATYRWDGENLMLNEKSALHGALLGLGMTLDLFAEVEFPEPGGNPFPALDAALRKRAGTHAFSMFFDERGYPAWNKFEKARTEACVPWIIEATGGESADAGSPATSGKVFQDDSAQQIAELMQIVADEVLAGRPVVQANGKLTGEGVYVAKRVIRVIGELYPESGILHENGDGKLVGDWPPTTWGEEGMTTALMALAVLCNDLKKIPELVGDTPEMEAELRSYLEAQLELVPNVPEADDDPPPF